MSNGNTDQHEPPSNENLLLQLQDINTWGAELIRSMEELRTRLHQRADELASVRRTLAARQHELGLEGQRLEQHRASSDVSLSSKRPDVGTELKENVARASFSTLESERVSLAKERHRSKRLATGLDEDRHQLEAERADLEAIRNALIEERAELERAAEAASAIESERELAWGESLAELQKARESIASLRSQLEYERRMAAQRTWRAEPELPAASTSNETIGQLQRLSRDARRRARGS